MFLATNLQVFDDDIQVIS